MHFNYDRQNEIYGRIRHDSFSTSENGAHLIFNPDNQSLAHWRQNRILAPLKPLFSHHSVQQSNWLTIGDGFLGREAQWLLSQGVSVHASDLATDLLEVAYDKGLITSFSQENAEQLSFADDSFDYVLIKEALHHLPRPWLALYEAFRVCKLGVVLIEPNGEHPRPLSIALRWIRRLPSTINYRFEKVGNFVYAPAPIELEKFLLGMGGSQIAFRFFNDFWLSAEADASPIHGGTPYQKSLCRRVMNTIRFRNLLSCSGLVPSAKISALLCKKPLHDEVHKSLVSSDWSVKILPHNPFLAS